MRAWLRVTAVIVLIAPTAARAQPQDGASASAAPAKVLCQTAYEKRPNRATLPADATEDNYCAGLASIVVTTLLESARSSPSPDTLDQALAAVAQPQISSTLGTQASVAQTSAVADGRSVAAAGGSVAMADTTGGGLQLVTAMVVNPFSATGSQSSVWKSQLGDVSLVLPLELESAEGAQVRRFSYVGARARVNLAALSYVAALERNLKSTFQTKYNTLASLIDTVKDALKGASDPEQCASAIEEQNNADQVANCKGGGAAAAAIAAAIAAETAATTTARKALSEFREEADRRYLSLEARWDRGDLNGDDADHADWLAAGYLAGGYNLRPETHGTSLELRGRAGIARFHDGMSGDAQLAYFIAIGTEIALVRDLKRYTFSLGLELVKRGSGSAAMAGLDEFQGKRVRIGISVPLADGKMLSAGVGMPFDGSAPTVSLSGDWALLLGR